MAWSVAPALVTLANELNKVWPNRDKTSDGTIGDAAHSARVSQHNPNRDPSDDVPDGYVTARDIDKDGINVKKVLDALIGDSRVWYVIYNGTIWSRTSGWTPRRYTGSNPHTGHIHVSLRQDRDSVNSKAGWGLVATTPAPKPKPVETSTDTYTYTVRSGDTLSAIAEKNGTTVEALQRLNNIENPDVLQVGQKLKLKENRPPAAEKPKFEKLSSGVKPGKRHNQVKLLQRLLIKAGYGPIRGSITTFYGQNTQAAVAKFHRRNPQFAEKPGDVEIGPKGFQHLQQEAENK